MKRALVLLVAWLLLTTGCAHEQRSCGGVDDQRPIDPVLLAFLSRARSAHHAADAAEAANDKPRAIALLSAVSDGPLPPGSAAQAPEVREVLADTLARLAELASQRNDFDAAERSIERGLALVPTATYFRGHLYEVRGLCEERRANQLDAQGHANEARAARQRALEALEMAMKIQATVIERAPRNSP